MAIVNKTCGCCGALFQYDTNINRWRGVCDICRTSVPAERISYKTENKLKALAARIDVEARMKKNRLAEDNALARYYGVSYGEIIAMFPDYNKRVELYRLFKLSRTLLKKRRQKTSNEELNKIDEQTAEGVQQWQPERTQRQIVPQKI